MSVPARGAAAEPSTIAAVRVPILPTAAYPGARFATTDLREQVTALWGDPVLREAVALAAPSWPSRPTAPWPGGRLTPRNCSVFDAAC
ncbi:MAG: hypothetical protein L0G49_00505 [Luteococcus sp.]|uniref:hypothetical protein n=1 Tax=Luteococcus sp. TaxID=1969402 RepID=UPI0026485466|nr:hypothetical protein [Luteococcus sp.]MDN5562256.1 hypothetical protein [Luteococcus sp.]